MKQAFFFWQSRTLAKNQPCSDGWTPYNFSSILSDLLEQLGTYKQPDIQIFKYFNFQQQKVHAPRVTIEINKLFPQFVIKIVLTLQKHLISSFTFPTLSFSFSVTTHFPSALLILNLFELNANQAYVFSFSYESYNFGIYTMKKKVTFF